MVEIELPEDRDARAEVLSRYAGLWIALDGNTIVAAVETMDGLYEVLDRMNKPFATVFRVPDPEQGVFVGLS